MKVLIALALAACAISSTYAQTNVGVSIGINQPGVYGRVDIGNYQPPRLVYPQPVVIVQSAAAVQQQPTYLYVPPGHQKNWAKHCGRYRACGQPVYFVQESWVRERYEEDRSHGNHGKGHGKDKKDKKDKKEKD